MTTYNIMILGKSGVGKTTYINRLITGDFANITPIQHNFCLNEHHLNKPQFNVNFVNNLESADGCLVFLDILIF